MTESIPSTTATTAAERLLKELAAVIEADLRTRLEASELPGNLREAVKYSVLNGGKRLRPGLVLLSAQACGGRQQDVLPAASALELIHCFSLVHDDLPAMDDDDLRRGKPTLHIHAGEAMAILAGDAMVSLAFEFIAQCNVPAAARLQIVSELAQATTAMIAGQVYDTLGGFADQDAVVQSAHDRDLSRLHLIHRNKTGALIRSACRMGAIGAGATPSQLAALSDYGQSMGFMFQIVDDLLDVTQSTEHLGKAAGKDQSAGKLTFPGVLGIEESKGEVQRMLAAALASIASFGSEAQPLRVLAHAMAVRTK